MLDTTRLKPQTTRPADPIDLYRSALPVLAEGSRAESFEAFESLGLPSRKLESWHFTDPGDLARIAFLPAPETETIASAFPPLVEGADARICLFNGRLQKNNSFSGDGIASARFFPSAWNLEREAFFQLNKAIATPGFCLEVGSGWKPESVLEIHHAGLPTENAGGIWTQSQIKVKAGVKLQLVENFASGGGGLNCPWLDINLEEGASLEHVRVQRQSPASRHLGFVTVSVDEGARYTQFSLMAGAALARQQIAVRLKGKDARTSLLGCQLVGEESLCDTTSEIDHKSAETYSNELYKSVLTEKARAVFQGRIGVRRDAQRIEGYQMNRALLLSPTALMSSKPELEIFADDVKCSHGATSGELDSEALFYLRARGLGEAASRRLLTQAFAFEPLEQIESPRLRDVAESCLVSSLDALLERL